MTQAVVDVVVAQHAVASQSSEVATLFGQGVAVLAVHKQPASAKQVGALSRSHRVLMPGWKAKNSGGRQMEVSKV